jgi:hypothetical protein
MKAVDVNTKLVDSYLALLHNMSASNKLDLISRLTQSVKADLAREHRGLEESYGAWDQEETAEELIAKIRGARVFTKKIEEF